MICKTMSSGCVQTIKVIEDIVDTRQTDNQIGLYACMKVGPFTSEKDAVDYLKTMKLQ